MTVDRSNPECGSEGAHAMTANWESQRRRHDGLDRAAMTTSFHAALDEDPVAHINLAATSAGFGALYAASGGTQSALIDELDLLETSAFDFTSERDPTDAFDKRELLARLRRVHALAAMARRAAMAAFDYALTTAAIKRVTMARHDIINTIGAARNATLLLEESASSEARERFLSIAKRNSFTSEALVRSHLSDHSILSAALGWAKIASSKIASSGLPSVEASFKDGDQIITNVDAVDALIGLLAVLAEVSGRGDLHPVQMSFAALNDTSGVLTVHMPSFGGGEYDARVADDIGAFAAAIGLRLEADSGFPTLRFSLPLSGGDQRNELGGADQGQHSNSS